MKLLSRYLAFVGPTAGEGVGIRLVTEIYTGVFLQARRQEHV